MVLAVVAGGATSMRSGSLRNWLTRRVISGGIVAEKNSVCRRGGSSLQIFSMSGMKPMSSMRSASSMTRISTPISMMRPRWKWSSRRPGVAIRHVDAAIELLDLIVHRHAADQQRQVQLVVDAVLLEALRHLRGELARRRQDQRAGHARPGAARLEAGDHRQNERCGLAGARLGDAENVAAGHCDRDGGGLNRSRRRVAGSVYGRLHLGAQSELREGLSFQK